MVNLRIQARTGSFVASFLTRVLLSTFFFDLVRLFRFSTKGFLTSGMGLISLRSSKSLRSATLAFPTEEKIEWAAGTMSVGSLPLLLLDPALLSNTGRADKPLPKPTDCIFCVFRGVLPRCLAGTLRNMPPVLSYCTSCACWIFRRFTAFSI